MGKSTPMPPALRDEVAAQFRALAESSRLRLLELLCARAHTVGELVTASGLSLANTSKHLGILHRAGWVNRRKVGVRVVCSLADARAYELCALMCSRVREQTHARAADCAARPPRRVRT
jgi:DNA-binding transcriptional ArsR family regulator